MDVFGLWEDGYPEKTTPTWGEHANSTWEGPGPPRDCEAAVLTNENDDAL